METEAGRTSANLTGTCGALTHPPRPGQQEESLDTRRGLRGSGRQGTTGADNGKAQQIRGDKGARWATHGTQRRRPWCAETPAGDGERHTHTHTRRVRREGRQAGAAARCAAFPPKGAYSGGRANADSGCDGIYPVTKEPTRGSRGKTAKTARGRTKGGPNDLVECVSSTEHTPKLHFGEEVARRPPASPWQFYAPRGYVIYCCVSLPRRRGAVDPRWRTNAGGSLGE